MVAASFSAKQMFSDLGAASGPHAVLTGLVKPVPKDGTIIMFLKGDRQSKWMTISEKQVARYDYIGRALWEGEDLPLVNLYLTEPASEEARLFMFAEVRNGLTTPLSTVLERNAHLSFTPCYYDPQQGRWICP